MNHAPHDHSQFDGCDGTCGQGRRACNCREHQVLRETRPADLLPVSADPAQAAPSAAVGMVLGIAALGLVALGWLAVVVFK